MVKGVHALFYTTDPEAARAFFRDKLGLPYTDTGGGLADLDTPEGDIGCHPSDSASHNISLYCDDIEETVGQLKGKGVEFTPIKEEEWGRVTTFELPGGGPIQLYEPKYTKR